MITLMTTEHLVEQAIAANVEAYRKAEQDYYHWHKRLMREDCTPDKAATYSEFKEASFSEFMAIKETLLRLFPDHKEQIIIGLNS